MVSHCLSSYWSGPSCLIVILSGGQRYPPFEQPGPVPQVCSEWAKLGKNILPKIHID